MDRLPIRPEKAICQICNVLHEHGGLAMGTVFLPEEQAREKERLMGQATHFAWCKECEQRILDGYIALLEFDEKLTVGEVPFRTGRMNWVQSFRLRELFNEESYLEGMKKKALYLPQGLFQFIEDILNPKEDDDREPPAENGGLFNYNSN